MVDVDCCAGVVSTAATLGVHWVTLVVGHQGGVQSLVVVGPRIDFGDGCCHRGSAEEVCMPVERSLEAVQWWSGGPLGVAWR